MGKPLRSSVRFEVLILANLYRVRTVISSAFASDGLSTNYFLVTGGSANATDAATVAGRVRAGWAAIAGLLSTATTVTVQPVVDIISDATGELTASFAIAAPATVTGSGAAVNGPIATAVGVRWLTNTFDGGRRLRGRTFVSPIGSQATDFPTPQAAEVTLVNAYVAAVLTGTVPAATAPLVVWSRPSPGGSDGFSGAVTSGAIAPQFFQLRSRRP